MAPSADLDAQCPSSSSSSSDEESEEDELVEDRKQGVDEEKVIEDDKKRKYLCTVCGRGFPFPNKLREHMRVHNHTYECRECSNQKFGSYNELRAHSKTYHSKAHHKCTLCSYTNSKPAFVNKHFRLNHIEGVPCTISGCTIKVAKNRLKTHIRECHSTNNFSIFPSSLKRARVSWNECPLCDYKPDALIIDVNRRHEDLMSHIKTIHENKGVIECPFEGCDARIKLPILDSHLKKCHSDSPSTSGCSSQTADCDDTMTMTSQTTEDLETSDAELSDFKEEREDDGEPVRKRNKMSSEGSFECEKCGGKFTSLYNLRRHIRRVHERSYAPKKNSSLKDYNCSRQSLTKPGEVCEKAFRTEQALIDHHNVHDGIKPYGCSTCKQRFYGRDRLAVHLTKYHQMSIKVMNANEYELGMSRSSAEPSEERELEYEQEDTMEIPGTENWIEDTEDN